MFKKLKPEQMKYLGLFVAYIIVIIAMTIWNPGSVMTEYGGGILFIYLLVSLVLMIMVFGYSWVGSSPVLIKFGTIFLFLFVLGLLFWWILTAFGAFSNNAESNIVSILFNVAILLGALTLLYKFSNIGVWIKQNSIYRLLNIFFLFIPCLFSDGMNKLRGVKSTSFSPANPLKDTQKNDVIGLLVIVGFIAAGVILTLWIIPGLKKSYFLKGGNQLVKNPISIDQAHTISSFAALNDSGNSTKLKPSYNYGISFWLYVDSFPPSTSSAYSKYSTILNYGGVPLVKYYAATNTMGIYIQNNKNTHDKNNDRLLFSYDHMPLQKWNNVVINYLNGTMDIFYNGKLISSSIDVSPPITYDTLTVGMDDGISGNIANVVYYPIPLSLYQINTLYTSLKNASPPTD